MLLKMALFHSFLWLSAIPLDVCTAPSSSDTGCLGCSRVLAVVNNAAVNTGVHVSFRIRVLSFPGICPGLGFLDRVAAYF